MKHSIQAGQPALILAPMEGVTDAPMREFLTELGGFDFCVSEFLRVSQNSLPAKVIKKHMPEISNHCRTRSGTPVQLQLLGGNSSLIAETALAAVEAGALSIDLNFGCPAPTVNRHDGGATLLKYPERLRAIVASVRQAVPQNISVSAKLRLGWDDINDIDHNAVMAAEGGAAWITIHGRTRSQGYRPPAWWAKIAETKKRLHPLPVVANGEIWTREDFQRCRDETQCEHYMIGRGALGDPTLAPWIHKQLHEVDPSQVTLQNGSWPVWIARFSEIAISQRASDHAVGSRIKQWVKFAKVKNNFAHFEQIKSLNTSKEIIRFLNTL